MHAMKLPVLPAGAGGAPALLSPVIPSETVEINARTDIGMAICFYQALLGAGESMRLTFKDSGTWIGGVLLTREEEDDLAVMVEGRIFNGQGDERGVSLSFRCEPDGPIGLPIVSRDCCGDVIGVYTDEDEPAADAATVRAAFFADGTSFTAATAPEVKPESHLGYAAESRKLGAALSAAAKKAMSTWLPVVGKEQGKPGGNNGVKWYRDQGKTLVTMDPGEKIQSGAEPIWPRPMPRPAKPTPLPAKATAKDAAKPAPPNDAKRPAEGRAVIKRRAGVRVPMSAVG